MTKAIFVICLYNNEYILFENRLKKSMGKYGNLKTLENIRVHFH